MPSRLPARRHVQQLSAFIVAPPAVAVTVGPRTPTRSFGIRSLYPPRHSGYNVGPDLPPLHSQPSEARQRKAGTTPLRTGVLAIKKGMTALFDQETGTRTPCTVLQLDRVQVVSYKCTEKHGYCAVQVGAGWTHENRVTKPMLGHFSKFRVSPKKHIHEFRVRDESGLLKAGHVLQADWFQVGQYVDARANSRGMGFTGAMKRHGFAGQDRTHGHSLSHRSLGSTGARQGGGARVYPGKKMAGRMGNQQVTTQNLKVLSVDVDKGLVVVSG